MVDPLRIVPLFLILLATVALPGSEAWLSSLSTQLAQSECSCLKTTSQLFQSSSSSSFETTEFGPIPPETGRRRTRRRFSSFGEHEPIDVLRDDDNNDFNDDDNDPKTDGEIDLENYRINLQLAQLAEQCSKRQKNVTAAVEALRLLRGLSHPDSIAYNTVLKALAKTSPTKIVLRHQRQQEQPRLVCPARLASELLEEMIEQHEQQVAANAQWYQALASNRPRDDDENDKQMARGAPRVRVKPNCRTFSTVMDAWARLRSWEGAQMCHTLLLRLQERHAEKGHDLALQPNLITFNTLLTAYGKSGRGEQAEQACWRVLHEDMPRYQLQPDSISHNAMLHVMARSGQDNAGERAQDYLRNHIVPTSLINSRSYTTVMDAWSQQGRPDQAHLLLDEMIAQHQDRLRPNVITYTTLIHAYAVSSLPDKALQAYRLYQDMQTRHNITPNTITTNALLNAFASSPTITTSLTQLFRSVYDSCIQNHRADHFTFGTVLKACANFDPPLDNNDNDNDDSSENNWKETGDDSDRFAVQVFEQARRSGQVSDGVWKQFRNAVSSQVYLGVLQRHNLIVPTSSWMDTTREEEGGSRSNYERIVPREWRRNVRNQPSHSQRRLQQQQQQFR